MSSSKNRGKGAGKKPRPKKTTAKKAAPRQTTGGQATASSVTAQATEGDIKADEATPEESLVSAGQATNDDEMPGFTESQPDGRVDDDEAPADGETERLSEAAPASDQTRAPETDGHAAEEPQDDDPQDESLQAEAPDRTDTPDDDAAEPRETASDPAQGSPAVESAEVESSQQTPVDDARPAVASGTTAAVPSRASAPADAKTRDEGVGDPERTDDVERSDEGTETSEATSPNEGGRKKMLGKVFAGLLAVGLGFAVMTQVRQTEKSGLDKLSQADLVALLADVNAQSSRLNTELDELRATKQKLDSGGDSAAVADAQKRLDQLSVLNGTTKVKGPGISIAVTNTRHEVSAANVLDAVEELRDAGAESIEVDGTRVVASTWFSDEGGRPTVEGRALNDTFTIRAIGDPHTMSTAMAIPGGVTDTLTQAGAQVKVTEDTSMQINSVVASTR